MKLKLHLQIVQLFEGSSHTEWTFQINWLDRSISIFRDGIKLAKIEGFQLQPTTEYLESLTKQFNTVRTLQ